MLRGAIFAVTAEDRVDGYELTELGAVSCDASERGRAESILAVRAARTFVQANVLCNLTRKTQKTRYQAGTGPRGNPYYKTRTRTVWEATACEATPVVAAPVRRRRWRRPRVIVDGSNVAHWGADTCPSLKSVSAVIAILKDEGLKPLVVFDASIGYKVGTRYLGAAELRSRLGGRPRVEVVAKGVNADVRIIEAAAKLDADIVSNDLFRDSRAARNLRKRRGFFVPEFNHAEVLAARR